MQGIVPRNIIKEYNKTRGFFQRSKLCYAPFNALRFSLSGNIYSCCFNRFNSLGKYPGTSIKEAWTGAKAEQLRQAVSNNCLLPGCHSCYSKITKQNYYSAGARNYDPFKILESGPSLMDFEISNLCNLECIMCTGENSSLIRQKREKGEYIHWYMMMPSWNS